MACWCNGNCPHKNKAVKPARAGRHQRAEMALRQALSEAPFCVEANLMLADIMAGSNRPKNGYVHLLRALKTEGATPRVQIEIARNLRAQARPRDAEIAFISAVDLDETSAPAWGGWIGALEAQGKLAEAMEIFDRAKTHFEVLPVAVRFQAANVMLDLKNPEGAIALLEIEDITPAEKLLRGRCKEALGDYAGAWADWSDAKLELAEKQGHIYWREHFAKLWAGLYEISQPARYRLLQRVPESGVEPNPFFVTGFPRSGTTMLETALASHSRIADGDELGGMSDVVHALPRSLRARLPYPQCLGATLIGDNSLVLTQMRDLYWRKSQEKIDFKFGPALMRDDYNKAPWLEFFTDKMPMQDMHLPLVRLLFPNAPFIYIKRHPLDVFVSCMSHNLGHGGHYAQSLETLAEHYTGADALRQHYRNVLDQARYDEIRYEDLVADLAGNVQDVLSMAGLELEPACVDFHQNPRQSHTISYRQVKQPLYTSSIARFKNYRQWLEPVLSMIEPILARENYDL